jgi:glycosyltransferase involved in cell wall biosynthesis
MKIYFFTKGDAKATSTRYRVFFTAEALERLGTATKIYQPPFTSVANSSRFHKMYLRVAYIYALICVSQRDIIYLQRTVYSDVFAWFVAFLKTVLRKKIVLDFCDPLFLVEELRPRIEFMMRFANAVVTADPFAFEYASRYAKKVFLMPMAVPLWILDKHQKEYGENIDLQTIGWIGNGPDHYENLKLVAPALQILVARGVTFRFRLIGALKDQRIYDLFAPLGVQSEIIDTMDWSAQDEVYEAIRAFDIGIVPSIDTEWFRVKVFLKPLEMMGIGLVTVISRVGVTGALIDDGRNGFLSDNDPKLWADVLERVLFLSVQERQHVSHAAIAEIDQKRSLAKNMPAFKEFLSTL